MPSIFISYSHNPSDLMHGRRVARLAASLLRDGLKVFFDQNREDEERGLPWPIWMEDKILEADHVFLICTELYLKKVRREVGEDQGQGVCWEANIIYALLYESKMNTTKFSPVLFLPADRRFIPTPLKGRDCFIVDSQSEYDRLYAFVTDQPPIIFSKQGQVLRTVAQEKIEPLFGTPSEVARPAKTDSISVPDKPIPATTPHLTLRPNVPPAPRQDIRGLDWYDECDAGHFLGRDDDADRILAMLLSHPVIRLVGPSGIGKSSLIRAGLPPKIREFGWRACVIRPFENPAQRIPLELTEQLLTSPGAFTPPLDTAKFRADVAPLLSSDGINRLVLFLDQFEDIVSPVAAPGAVDAMREFLGALWEQKETKPYLRAVVVYRTDADARLGRLWQEISGKSEGLPYFVLQGLSRSVAETIIKQGAGEQGWRLEASVPEIVRQLALESQKLDCSGDVFPVYLQIFLKQAELNPERRITAEFITSLGGVSGLIGKYLEQTLERLKAHGGEWQQCGAVLESLSRSSGAKATQSFDDLVRETGVSRAVLAEMLRKLINERLVRPVGHETYEIQHDHLASAVIESMKDSDRDAKAAREFLAAKVSAFERTMVPLDPEELVYLYRHRRKIHPADRELRLLLASILHNIEARETALGAYWFGESSPQDFLCWFMQIEHWAAKNRRSFRPSRAWAGTFPLFGLESQFAILAVDSAPPLRKICAQWIGRTKRDEDLPLLRELAKDQDAGVRARAVEALASFSQTEALPLLSQLVKNQDANVRLASVGVLANFSQAEALPLLGQLAKDSNANVCVAALKVLANYSKKGDSPLARELAENQDADSGVRVAALKTLASFSKKDDLRLRELDKDDLWSMRAAALDALASFSQPEDLPLLRELAKNQDADSGARVAALRALVSFSQAEDLPLLGQLIKADRYATVVSDAALDALASFSWTSFSQAENLPLLRELAKNQDANSRVRAVALRALAGFFKEEDLSLLRELAGNQDANSEVRAVALRALASFLKEEDLSLLRESAKDHDSHLRATALTALASFLKEEDLSLLRESAKDADYFVRAAAQKALISFLKEEKDLALLRELVANGDLMVRDAALKAVISFSKEEDLPLLCKTAKDAYTNSWVCDMVLKALASFSKEKALSLLRELATDYREDVRAAARETLASFSKEEALPLLRELARDYREDVHAAAIETLASFSKEEALPLLRELAKDHHREVSLAAIEALASFSKEEARALLRELAKDHRWEVSLAALKTLASFSKEEALPLLRELALTLNEYGAVTVVRSLALLSSREELETFLNRHDHELCVKALGALDELLYMPEWLKANDG